jgi:hypothetical protein
MVLQLTIVYFGGIGLFDEQNSEIAIEPGCGLNGVSVRFYQNGQVMNWVHRFADV